MPVPPLGVIVIVSIMSWLNWFGGWPNQPTISGAKTATKIRKMMTPAPVRATLSRFRRIQAIWPSDRPWIAFAPAPSVTDSGVAFSSPPETSSGAVMRWAPWVPDDVVPTGARRVRSAPMWMGPTG